MDGPDLFSYAESMRPSAAADYLAGIPPDVVSLFERLSLHVRDERGFERYSARAILHRIRWHFHVEKGDHGFKCNNNWTPRLARWFLDRHPENPDFFELRELRHDE